MHLVTWVIHALAAARYPVISVVVFIEGPMVMIVAGFLLRQHILHLVPLFVAIFVGDLVADCMWYAAGRFFASRISIGKSKLFGIAPDRFAKIKALFLNHQVNILFISKLTLGFGLAKGVLMAAGATRVSFKKFIIINAVGELLLVAGLLCMGYFFGDIYLRLADQIRPWFTVFVVLMIMGLLAWLAAYARRRVDKLP